VPRDLSAGCRQTASGAAGSAAGSVRLRGGFTMHIVALLTALAGVIGIVLWRMTQAANAARDVADAANEVSSLARRWAWWRKSNRNPLDSITDPREAAVAMMAAIAQYDGNLTERERVAIVGNISQAFDANAKQAEELLAQARFLVKDVTDPSACFNRLAPTIEKQLGPNERFELIEMLNKVANADGAAGEAITRSIAQLRRRLAV
jgi:uncharacterized tellurite resistance protein B-like protein